MTKTCNRTAVALQKLAGQLQDWNMIDAIYEDAASSHEVSSICVEARSLLEKSAFLALLSGALHLLGKCEHAELCDSSLESNTQALRSLSAQCMALIQESTEAVPANAGDEGADLFPALLLDDEGLVSLLNPVLKHMAQNKIATITIKASAHGKEQK